jgi:hypothetical protein
LWNIFLIDSDFKDVGETFWKVAGKKKGDGPNRNHSQLSVFLFLLFSGKFSESKDKKRSYG